MRIKTIFFALFSSSLIGLFFGYADFRGFEASGFSYFLEIAEAIPYISVPLTATLYALGVQTVAFWEFNDKETRFSSALFGYMAATLWLFFLLLPKRLDTSLPYDLYGRDWAGAITCLSIIGCVLLTKKWVWQVGKKQPKHPQNTFL